MDVQIRRSQPATDEDVVSYIPYRRIGPSFTASKRCRFPACTTELAARPVARMEQARIV